MNLIYFFRYGLRLVAFLSLVTGCHLHQTQALDPVFFEEKSVQISSPDDQKRLQEIHQQIQQLKMSIEYQEMMADRYTVVTDFYRQERSLQHIQTDKDEIKALEKEREKILARYSQRS